MRGHTREGGGGDVRVNFRVRGPTEFERSGSREGNNFSFPTRRQQRVNLDCRVHARLIDTGDKNIFPFFRFFVDAIDRCC